MNSSIPHHNFYVPGGEGQKSDQSFYISDEESREDSSTAQIPEPERPAQGQSWQAPEAGDYWARLSMAVEQLKVPVTADPEFRMVMPEADEHAVQEDTSKTTAFSWEDGTPKQQPDYFDALKAASKIKVPLRRTDMDNVKAFQRSEGGTLTELPVIKEQGALAVPVRETPVPPSVHRYEAIDIAEDLRKLGNARDPRQVHPKELLVADALKEGEALDDDKRFENLYHDILGEEFMDASGQRVNRNEVIHMIRQVRESIKANNLAQAELFLRNIPAAGGLHEKVRRLTRIHELQVEHARRSLADAYNPDRSKDGT